MAAMWHWMTDPSGPGLPIWLSGPEQKVSPGQLVFDSRWLVLMTPPGLQQHHNFFYGCMQIFFQHSLWSVIVIRLSRSVGSRFCKAFVQLLWFSSPMYLCIYTPLFDQVCPSGQSIFIGDDTFLICR